MAAKSISFLANQKLEFKLNEKDPKSETFIAQLGFNKAPAWVGKTDLFKLASGGIRPFINKVDKTQTVSDIALEKAEKENAELRKKIEAFEMAAEKKPVKKSAKIAKEDTEAIPEK